MWGFWWMGLTGFGFGAYGARCKSWAQGSSGLEYMSFEVTGLGAWKFFRFRVRV